MHDSALCAVRGGVLLIGASGAAVLAPPADAQSPTPQPVVLTMERITRVGPGQVDAQGAPLTETARGRLSELPWISPDGRFVVFTTAANTLDRKVDETFTLPFTLPFTGPDTGGLDVYLVDRSLPDANEARVRRLSRRKTNNATPNQGSSFGVIDDAGAIAVFQSKATNLDPGQSETDSFTTSKVYMVDLVTGATTLLSRDAAGSELPGAFPAVSGDGRYVFFGSGAKSLPKPGGAGVFDSENADEDIFRYDRQTGEFGLVTVASNQRDGFPAASFDGAWAVIESEMQAGTLTGMLGVLSEGPVAIDTDIFLVQGASANGASQPPTFPVSLSTTPNTMGAAASRFPAVSHDARYVAFVSWADDLVLGDGAGNPDTFVRDLGADPSANTGPTARVSVGGSTSSGPVVDNFAESGCAWGCRPSVVHLPTDGVNPGVVVVAFVTLAQFDDYDDNDAWDVYVRVMREDDLSCADTYLVSAPAHDTGGARAAADMASFNPSLRGASFLGPDPQDPQGQSGLVLLRLAFESYATNLDASTTDGNDTRDIHYAEVVVHIPVCP